MIVTVMNLLLGDKLICGFPSNSVVKFVNIYIGICDPSRT